MIAPTTNRDYLLLYSAGTGGEFFASAISECTAQLNTLSRVQLDNNTWNTVCKVGYADVVLEQGVLQSGQYISENNDLSDMYKDHPVDAVHGLWPDHMHCLFLTVPRDYYAWSATTWHKLKDINIELEQQQFLDDHAAQIKRDYLHREQWAHKFDNYTEIPIDRPSAALQRVFDTFDTVRFNTLYTEWKNNNDR